MIMIRPIVLAFITLAVCTDCDVFKRPRQSEKINEQAEFSNDVFKIRVTAYAEQNAGFVGGAYYVFDSAPIGSNNWQRIVTVRHDDPIPIPHQQIRFVSDKVGYVFMIWTYAVTTDAGATWKVWDAFKDLPQLQDHPPIEGVRIESDGTGKMTFRDSKAAPDLHTKDYGNHWSVE